MCVLFYDVVLWNRNFAGRFTLKSLLPRGAGGKKSAIRLERKGIRYSRVINIRIGAVIAPRCRRGCKRHLPTFYYQRCIICQIVRNFTAMGVVNIINYRIQNNKRHSLTVKNWHTIETLRLGNYIIWNTRN